MGSEGISEGLVGTVFFLVRAACTRTFGSEKTGTAEDRVLAYGWLYNESKDGKLLVPCQARGHSSFADGAFIQVGAIAAAV